MAVILKGMGASAFILQNKEGKEGPKKFTLCSLASLMVYHNLSKGLFIYQFVKDYLFNGIKK